MYIGSHRLYDIKIDIEYYIIVINKMGTLTNKIIKEYKKNNNSKK